MVGFWRWYDRGARFDFLGTLIGFFFDWKTWLAGILGGGGVTSLWAFFEGRQLLDIWVMALVTTAAGIIIAAAGLATAQSYFGQSEDTAPRDPRRRRTFAQLERERNRWRRIAYISAAAAAAGIAIAALIIRPADIEPSIDILFARLEADSQDQVGFNVYVKNRAATAVGPRFQPMFTSSPNGRLGRGLDEGADLLLSRLKSSRDLPITQELPIGKQHWWTAWEDKRSYEDSRNGSIELYLMAFIEYKSVSAKRKWRVTEACWRIWPNGSLSRCGNYNRTYTRE
jgi:hypothetical protein